MKIKKHSCIALFILFSFACNQTKVKDIEGYLEYLNDGENGLVKTKYVNGLELKIKYIPPRYSAYLELNNNPGAGKNQQDSLLQVYSNNLTFMFTIGPDERKRTGTDIMLRNVASYKEYAERHFAMNFAMEEFITLEAGDKKYKPVLSSMENVYGLDPKRNILLVFSPSEKGDRALFTGEKLDFVYSDELFGLGVNHFVFNRKDIHNIPELEFPTNQLAEK